MLGGRMLVAWHIIGISDSESRVRFPACSYFDQNLGWGLTGTCEPSKVAMENEDGNIQCKGCGNLEASGFLTRRRTPTPQNGFKRTLIHGQCTLSICLQSFKEDQLSASRWRP